MPTHSTPEQSLALVEQVLRDTERKATRLGALPMLTFGYLTLASALIVYLLLPILGPWINLIWLAIPLLSFAILHWAKRSESHSIRTVGDRFISALWIVISIGNILAGLTPRLQPHMLPLVLISVSGGTLITAYITRLRALLACSGFILLLGFALLHLSLTFEQQILIFSLAFWLLLCLPGHLLSWKTRKHER